jgi:hypothetical protein
MMTGMTMRGGVRGRGRGAAGSRGAGGVGRGYMPGFMRGNSRKNAVEVSGMLLSACVEALAVDEVRSWRSSPCPFFV